MFSLSTAKRLFFHYMKCSQKCHRKKTERLLEILNAPEKLCH